MRKQYEESTKTMHVHFDSLHDFFTNTNPSEPSSTMCSSNKSDWQEVKEESATWRFGNDRNRDTFYKNRFDPSIGREMCAKTVKETVASKEYKQLVSQAMTHRKRIFYEDHGFRLNVSKAISGEDRYFGVYQNSRKPTVKIAINICGSASVDAESFRNLAKTAVPMIMALETAGISTEVYYCAFSTDTFTDYDNAAVHVKIKSAQQRFNWSTFAPLFSLGSYRESIFLSWIYTEHNVSGGLGCPMRNYKLEQYNNYGYTSVIGFNNVGPVKEVTNIFKKLGKKVC